MTIEVPLHGPILQEAIRANAPQEEDDMMTIAVTMEGEAHHYQEADWMTDMAMDHRPRDEHRTLITILTIGEDRHLQVDILTHTEVETPMLDHEAQTQGMAVAVAMADMMEATQDDTGKFITFLLLRGCSSKGYVMTKHQLISSLLERVDHQLLFSAAAVA